MKDKQIIEKLNVLSNSCPQEFLMSSCLEILQMKFVSDTKMVCKLCGRDNLPHHTGDSPQVSCFSIFKKHLHLCDICVASILMSVLIEKGVKNDKH